MSNDRPNVLLFFTDQLRADVFGAAGNNIIRTPNIDRLWNEGTAFTSAYSPCPVCVPARASKMYGQYPCHTGCYENRYPMPTDDRPSFVDSLTEAGYRTHGIGKCHFTPDSQAMRGFQTRLRMEELVLHIEDDDYLIYLHDNGFGHVLDPHGVRSDMYYIPQPSQLPVEHHPTQWVGDRTLQFLDEQAGSAQPWFCFSSFVHPHPPFSPPVPWYHLYQTRKMPLPFMPEGYEQLMTWINRRQNRYKYRDHGGPDINLLRTMRAYYYACVSFIDYQVGRVLDHLEKTGQMDNTMILLSSDHGELLGDYYCFGKRSMLDPCSRIPMLMRQPGGRDSDTVCHRPVSLVDLAPTILNAADIAYEDGRFDGMDMRDVAAGTNDRQVVYSQWNQGSTGHYMAVSEHWKYTYYASDNKELLFERPGGMPERENLAGRPETADIQAGIKQQLIDFLTTSGETEGIKNGDWKVFPKKEMPEDPDENLLIQDSPWGDYSIPGYTGDKK